MDKYEYKVRAEEIRNLVEMREYAQAAEIADTIDWRKVRNVMMLCTVSDIYKVNRRYEDARDMLLLAYEQRPGGRNICYALCELYIKTEEIVQAVEYYKEFVQVAPRDPGRYILLYKIYEAQEVSLEERIEVLEELKKRDYRERWAYELAYLYHRVGLETRCVEECDEMILWFGEGNYVTKAMELKMLHQPLSAEQQEKYDHRFDAKEIVQTDTAEMALGQMEGELEEGYSEEGYSEEEYSEEDYPAEDYPAEDEGQESGTDPQLVDDNTKVYEFMPLLNSEALESAGEQPAEDPEELDIHVKTVDVGQYNTINLQAELAEGLREILDTEEKSGIEDSITRSIVAPMMEEDDELWEALQLEDPEAEDVPAAEQEAGQSEAADASTAEQDIPVLHIDPPKEIAHVLSQESDGQISLVLPESSQIEKQITGQMSIEDILAEWERMKKVNEEKRKEDVRQRVLQQTGNMFSEFDAAIRDGLLEQLEKSEDLSEGDDEIEELQELEEESDEQNVISFVDTEAIMNAGNNTEKAGEANAEAESTEAAAAGMTDTEAGAEAGDMEEADVAGLTEAESTESAEAGAEGGAEADADGMAEAESTESAEAIAESDATEAADTAAAESENTTSTAMESAEVKTAKVETAQAFEWEAIDDDPEQDVAQTDRPAGAAEEASDVPREEAREMTDEELEMYASYIQSKDTRDQIVRAVDSISLAAYTGNIIITGEEGMDTMTLAKNMIHEARVSDSNFSGKTAKISGQALNKKNVEDTLNLLQNGALIIQRAGDMNDATVQALYKSLQRENLGIVVLLEDKKKFINRLLESHEQLLHVFNARVDVEAPSNDELVAFGRQYAYEQEYSIDDFGMLALHTRIEELQTIDHAVTAPEVKEMVNDAIHHANRKTPGHFFDILLAKRYDDEDMIILTEKDFA